MESEVKYLDLLNILVIKLTKIPCFRGDRGKNKKNIKGYNIFMHLSVTF